MGMTPEEVYLLIVEALDAVQGNLQELAEECGVSYHTLRSWRQNQRTPGEDKRRRLATALRRRAIQLHHIATQLEGNEPLVEFDMRRFMDELLPKPGAE